MKTIRKYIRNILLESYDWEDCTREMYWGIGGSGVVVIREQAVDSAPGVWDLKTVYFYKTGTGWPS